MLALGMGILCMAFFNKDALVKRTHNIMLSDKEPYTEPQAPQKKKKQRTTLSSFNKETFLFVLYIICIIVAICVLADSIIVIKSGRAGLSILFLLFCAWHLHTVKIDNEKEKKEYAGRVIHGDWQIDHYYQSYNFDYLKTIEGQLELSSEYKLKKHDKEQVVKILQEFKKDLSEKYFSDRLGLPKTKYYATKNDDFLMYSLYLFLDKRYYHSFFCEEPMHKETIEYKNYDDDGYTATYSVTEFAITVFKLLYVSYMYCKNSKVLNPEAKFFDNEKHIEELITTKKISVSCYRP